MTNTQPIRIVRGCFPAKELTTILAPGILPVGTRLEIGGKEWRIDYYCAKVVVPTRRSGSAVVEVLTAVVNEA